jgi:hypothetical protein
MAKDNDELTAWHFASRRGDIQVLHKLWEWGKEALTSEEIYNKLLFAKYNEKRNASFGGKVQALK